MKAGHKFKTGGVKAGPQDEEGQVINTEAYIHRK